LKRIDYYDATGERKAIRIGKVSMRDAEKIKTKIEELNNAKINGTTPDVEVVSWLANRPAKVYDKLVRAGLTIARADTPKPGMPGLELFVSEYAAKRTDVKGATASVYKRWKKHLIGFFGPNKPIDEITAGDAEDWRLWLRNEQKLGRNTIARGCGIAKQFFTAARKRRVIAENPFAELSAQVRGNPDKLYFVPKEHAERILKAGQNLEYNAIFALSRFGGAPLPLGTLWIALAGH
jgi:Phage integrase SAM-like domain